MFKMLISKFFGAFMWALLRLLAGKIGTAAESIVAMVADLESGKLSGEKKGEKLAEQLKTLAATTGKDIGSSVINLAREVAVQIYKENLK